MLVMSQSTPGLQAQAGALDAHLDHRRAADQVRSREAFVDHGLHRAQDVFLLALGVDHPLEVAARAVEHRLHHQAGAEHELAQLLAVGDQVGDRARCHAGIHRRLRHGRRELHQQARVEGLRDQVVAAEAHGLAAVGCGRHVAGLLAREFRDRTHAGELHRLVDGGRADVKRAAEDVREAQRVVDLVRIVRTPRRDDAVRARLARQLRQDLRRRVGQREDDRVLGHGLDHRRRQHAGGRQAEEDVGAVDDVAQRARGGGLRVTRLGVVHVLDAPGVEHALAVGDVDVLDRQAERDQHVEAGHARGARAGTGQLDLRDVLADHRQCVEHRGADDDRRAVLVVVEDRDLDPLAHALLDVEALGRLDVLEVHAAEGRLQRGDDVDQLVGIGLVDLDVEHVDAGELLEQDALAFHHRLGGQRADVAQAQYGGAVADHGDEVGARGVLGHRRGVARDLEAGRGHAGRVGQREVLLGDHGLGRDDLDLARRMLAVVLERLLLELLDGVVIGVHSEVRHAALRPLERLGSLSRSVEPAGGCSAEHARLDGAWFRCGCGEHEKSSRACSALQQQAGRTTPDEAQHVEPSMLGWAGHGFDAAAASTKRAAERARLYNSRLAGPHPTKRNT